MPCDSSHMEATGIEIEQSRVCCLLNELGGQKWEKEWWAGYHPKAYSHADRHTLDTLTKALCEKLQRSDVSKYSLEMQIWWRDHQKADKERIELEVRNAADAQAKEAAIAKLTPHERKLLGL
jgi:hypothetical protein